MRLRDYQEYCVDSLFKYFETKKGNPLIVAPTGVGKSLIIAGFCQQALEKYPSTKILILTHVKELIEQNHSKLITMWPTAPAGIYSAGLGQKDVYMPITFGGIASIVKTDLKMFGSVDLMIIDEAHLVSQKEEAMYGSVISKIKSINPSLKVIGLTATDYRQGQGRLAQTGSLFTDVVVDMSKKESFNWFIEEGYILPLIPKKPNMQVDVSKIKIKMGEYDNKEAQAAIDKQEITYKACIELVNIAQADGRVHWVIFSTGVEHAVHISEMLDSMGISSTYVHSKMSSKERDKRIVDFKAGVYTAIVNNGILTTGFDDPNIDLIGMMRLTMSSSLWVQMLGRGTRPVYCEGYDLNTKEGRLASIKASTKQNCLVLDFAGNTRRLGPINDPIIPEARGSKKEGDAPVKICGACSCYNHASVRFCDYCGEEFPRYYKIKEQASTDELIASNESNEKTEVFNVDKVIYRPHIKSGKLPSLKVTYHCGLRSFTEYVCLEHGTSYAGKKARDWWRFASNNFISPATVEEAMTKIDTLRKPLKIKVDLTETNARIVDYEYN